MNQRRQVKSLKRKVLVALQKAPQLQPEKLPSCPPLTGVKPAGQGLFTGILERHHGGDCTTKGAIPAICTGVSLYGDRPSPWVPLAVVMKFLTFTFMHTFTVYNHGSGPGKEHVP